MKYVIQHHVTDPPHYELLFDNGEALKIHEDFFFDLISGCAVEYEKAGRKDPANIPTGTEIADQGEYNPESETRIVLSGEKIHGTLLLDPESGTVSIIPD